MNFLTSIEHFLVVFSSRVPLELYVFLGTLIEEIIAPIPSPLVMAIAGTIARAQSLRFFSVAVIIGIAAASKTLASWFFYFLSDKAEDLLIKKFGKFIGFSHKEVENIGKRFDGTSKDDWVLIFLRALPVMPSTPISVACGFIKLNVKTFIRSTLVGNLIRSSIFFFLGYSGLSILESLMKGFDNIENLINIVIILLIIAGLGWVYYKRGKGDFHRWFEKKTGKK